LELWEKEQELDFHQIIRMIFRAVSSDKCHTLLLWLFRLAWEMFETSLSSRFLLIDRARIFQPTEVLIQRFVMNQTEAGCRIV
jgi:hypothetical protein